ncbi:MAG: metallopeptidase family protein [Patescibacteria group bacterium]|jgi:predicted Zn-dependent protease with MMP-like domain
MLSRPDLEKMIREAILAIPEPIRRRIGNVAVVVEDRCRAGEDCDGGYWGENDLLGLFEGVPLVDEGIETSGLLPAKITIFRSAIEEEAETPAEIPKIVRETVWHEVAHYVGFDEAETERLEEKWERGFAGRKFDQG